MAETFDDRVSHSETATRFIKVRVTEVAPTLDSDDEDPTSNKKKKLKPALLTSIVAGGIAGVIVDIGLYPLDTFKTRLQSKEGFRASGGFKGVYRGIVPVLLSSAPISALFFATYNTMVNTLRSEDLSLNPMVYLVAATAAEVICSTVRVPIEVIKQRNQTSRAKSVYIIKKTLRKEGIYGLYRGFWSTLMREIPFAAVQYPLWEYMINQFIIYQNGKELTALQTAYCGAAAGAIAAAVTTPMDVIKTRMMLAEKEKLDRYRKYLNYYIAREVYRERGIVGLFAGTVPRVLWITLGGFIYFGAYEKAKLLCEENWDIFTFKIQKGLDTAPSYAEEKVEPFVFSKEAHCDKDNSETLCLLDESVEVKENKDNIDEQKIIDATLLEPSNVKSE